MEESFRQNTFFDRVTLCSDINEIYNIPQEAFDSENIKRGLRNSDGTGVIAGVTRVGSVQGYTMVDGVPQACEGRLFYRGIDMVDIIKKHAGAGTFGFEEVVYLLLLGRLPDEYQSRVFNEMLAQARKLPDGFVEDMIIKSPSPDIMNKIARSVLALYSYDQHPNDTQPNNMVRQSVELIGRLPVLAAAADAVRRRYYGGESLILHVPQEGLSLAENLLHMLRRDNTFTREEALLLDAMLIMHAEHGAGNNSAFTCRVIASTGSDTYACIAAALGSLKGPLHGGANARVMAMFDDVKANVRDTSDDAMREYLRRIVAKEAFDRSGKIYGLGHAVYTLSDPRAIMLKKYAAHQAERTSMADDFALMERIERIGTEVLYEKLGDRKKICANVDMYSGLVYKMLGFPEELFTPLFAIARIAGWCAHRIEEAMTGGRIIRPGYRAIG
ncbi:MAG: citrate synthase [Oscillospiraceae bacterium]|jgi:citrate synthase|nr:citrate synthase [Oscillospiraceae bacterium]